MQQTEEKMFLSQDGTASRERTMRHEMVNACYATLPLQGTPGFNTLLRSSAWKELPPEVLVRWMRVAKLRGDRLISDEVCTLLLDRIRASDQHWARRVVSRTQVPYGERAEVADDLYADLCESLIRAWGNPLQDFWEKSFQSCLWRERQHAFTRLLVREGLSAVGSERPRRIPRRMQRCLGTLVFVQGRGQDWEWEPEDVQAARALLEVEQHDASQTLLASLSRKSREVITLLFFKDLGEKQAAVMLGVTDRTVRNRLKKALAEARAVLRRTGEDHDLS